MYPPWPWYGFSGAGAGARGRILSVAQEGSSDLSTEGPELGPRAPCTFFQSLHWMEWPCPLTTLGVIQHLIFNCGFGSSFPWKGSCPRKPHKVNVCFSCPCVSRQFNSL